jgi:hypothetical protein
MKPFVPCFDKKGEKGEGLETPCPGPLWSVDIGIEGLMEVKDFYSWCYQSVTLLY